MTPAMVGVVLVGLCALAEGFAQISLKISAQARGRRLLWIGLGGGLFLVSAVVYSGALRFLNLSVAYALESLGHVSVAILSKWFLGEQITMIRWIGVGLIVAGTSLVVVQV